MLVVNASSVIDVAVSGIILGSVYGLLSAGFGLEMRVSRRFHFAFAVTFVLVPYLTIFFRTTVGVPLLPAVLLALAVTAVVDMSIERFAYQPLARRTTSAHTALLAVFVTSLGFVIIGENIVTVIWGSSDRTFAPFTPAVIHLGGKVTTTTADLFIFLVSAAVIVAYWVFWRFAKYGRALRAVSENPDMAQAVGINPYRAYVFVFAVGSVAVGLAGLFYTMLSAITPEGGLTPVLVGMVALFLAGGRSSPLRIGLAGLVVGLIMQLPQIWVNANWSPAMPFGLLFVYVCIRAALVWRSRRQRRPAPVSAPLSSGAQSGEIAVASVDAKGVRIGAGG